MKTKSGTLIWDKIDGEFAIITIMQEDAYDIFWSNSGYSSTPRLLFEDVMRTSERWEMVFVP